MAFIKKIEIPEVEALTREMINIGSRIRELQDSIELELIEQKRNLTDYKAGSIQRVAFKDVNAKFDKEKMASIAKLTAAVNEGLAIAGKMRTLVKAYKL
ncbi:MAG: hypothetical protein QXU82_01330 [Candidatus Aenigmatarchaeota archaeon]